MTDPDHPTRTEGEGETLDLPEGTQGFTTGWKIEIGSFPGWAEVPEW
jgi:hypothetical protein